MTQELIDTMSSQKCHFCGGTIIKHHYDLICANCGVVLATEMVPARDYYKSYSVEKGSMIFQQDIKTPAQKRLLKLHLLAERDVHLFKSYYHLLLRFASRFSLPASVKERALEILKRIFAAEENKKIEKITNHNHVLFFALIVAIREYNLPISFKEIKQFFKDHNRKITANVFNQKVSEWQKSLALNVKRSSYVTYVEKILSDILSLESVQCHLKLNNMSQKEYRKELLSIVSLLAEKAQPGAVNPHVFCCSLFCAADKIFRMQHPDLLLYKTFRQFISRKELSKRVGVSIYSLRSHFSKYFKNCLGDVK